MNLKKIFVCIVAIATLALSLVACAACPNHKDRDDDGACDKCAEAFADGCDTKECVDTIGNGRCSNAGCGRIIPPPCNHEDADDNKICDRCQKPFSDGCDNHKDKDDNGECDVAGCDEAYTDGCDRQPCLDTDNDGKCDNAGCNKETDNKPCNHADADDDGKCDECAEKYSDACDKAHADVNDDAVCDRCKEEFTDGCDTTHCLDTDNDGKCDNAGCDKETNNRACAHRDADDDDTCDNCGVGFSDACDLHRDADDNGACDECGASFKDSCDLTPHLDKDDDEMCDECGYSFTDACDVHKDKNDDYVCDTVGCGAVVDDGFEDETYAEAENYLPKELTDILYSEFTSKSEVFTRMYMNQAPFTYLDVFNLSDCRVLSVTIPVFATGEADENGDFTFTVHRIGNSFNSLSRKPLESYKIKINKDEYGLTPGSTNVYKIITVDLRGYDISLTENESFAFGGAEDTIIPAYFGANTSNGSEVYKAFSKYFKRGLGTLKSIGKGFYSDSPALLFDLQLEKRYENRAEYDKKIAAELEYERAYLEAIEQLKEIYGGLNASVLGDSISTFEGLSNNTDYNVTLTNRGTCMYPRWDKTLDESTETYWGRVIDALDMNLCVDNGWSGSMVYGNGGNDKMYKDSAVLRSTELHRDNGTPQNFSDDTNPDLIIFYMGVNDLDAGKHDVGDLLQVLDKNDGRSEFEKIDEWFENVLERFEDVGENSIVPGTSYTTFDQAYALALYRMLNRYEDAEIVCVNLVRNRYSHVTTERFEKFSRIITALGNYFGVIVVEQSGPLAELTYENGFLYAVSGEDKALHPNCTGHELMSRTIIKTLCEYHGIELPEKP